MAIGTKLSVLRGSQEFVILDGRSNSMRVVTREAGNGPLTRRLTIAVEGRHMPTMTVGAAIQ